MEQEINKRKLRCVFIIYLQRFLSAILFLVALSLAGSNCINITGSERTDRNVIMNFYPEYCFYFLSKKRVKVRQNRS